MKIALLSDLHISMHPIASPVTEADVVVVAGDVERPAGAIAWARKSGKPTVFVAGNHEYYGSDLRSTVAALRREAEGSAVHVLEHDAWVHQGVRFLGCTLWSDHRLYASEAQREAGYALAQRYVRDFSRIRVAPDGDAMFSPREAQAQCDRAVAWLGRMFDEPHDGPTVVVTHFAPSRASIHPRFADSPVNACFVSDLEAQIRRWQPAYWLHGHTHDSFHYRIGTTRVVANPRGYAPGGVNENAAFEPDLLLEL